MFNNLTALAMGVVVFAITIGVGVVVLQKFGGSLATCGAGFTFEANNTYDVCANATNTSDTAAPTNVEWTTTNALQGELGTSGLAGWTAAVVALAVGILFIAALAGKGRKY